MDEETYWLVNFCRSVRALEVIGNMFSNMNMLEVRHSLSQLEQVHQLTLSSIDSTTWISDDFLNALAITFPGVTTLELLDVESCATHIFLHSLYLFLKLSSVHIFNWDRYGEPVLVQPNEELIPDVSLLQNSVITIDTLELRASSYMLLFMKQLSHAQFWLNVRRLSMLWTDDRYQHMFSLLRSFFKAIMGPSLEYLRIAVPGLDFTQTDDLVVELNALPLANLRMFVLDEVYLNPLNVASWNSFLVLNVLELLKKNCPVLEHFKLHLVLNKIGPASRSFYTLAGLFSISSFSPENGPEFIGLTSLDGLYWFLINLTLRDLIQRCSKLDITLALRTDMIDVFYGDMAADAVLAIEHAITSHLRSSYRHKAHSSYALNPTEHSFEVSMDVMFLRSAE
ncbi:uncharacterized protein LAESUDRAFT_713829 [Laetiporus sulphureus 93-53]|uniref:Uncharacterized protein n=1 Tax=Laetiporus sulphureus 93-53 TaxID=1314785 RepID=A0A165EG85_9APHY|nr:uncharacterized protein LAESUDRAFT_713829 [Laetiporus sulphureus 93-53]KZT06995.1 hypothetical protein LAESUDRAFT_713829 [Laetiporus sulphureus 93-53]